jgi:hypothetical protein
MTEMSRTERRRIERQARKENRHQVQHKKRTASVAQRSVIYVVGALLLAGAGYWGYARFSEASPGQFVKSLGNRHISQTELGLTTYNSDPPTSGPHVPQIANWGVHPEPVPKEFQVHNLEDGGVVVQYDCPAAEAACKTLVDRLTGIVRKYDRVVLAPYPGMSNKIALTAWTRIDKFDELDEQRIVRFIESYIHIDHHPAGGES